MCIRDSTATAAINDGEVVATLSERILGRVTAEDVVKPGTEDLLLARNELIDERMSDTFEQEGVQ